MHCRFDFAQGPEPAVGELTPNVLRQVKESHAR
jgi:hypothetical protein